MFILTAQKAANSTLIRTAPGTTLRPTTPPSKDFKSRSGTLSPKSGSALPNPTLPQSVGILLLGNQNFQTPDTGACREKASK